MKRLATHVALVATLMVGASALAHHNHKRFHAERHQFKRELELELELELEPAPVEKRGDATVTACVAAQTLTEYVLDDHKIDTGDAQEGLDKGLYVIVGESTPTCTVPPAASTSATSSKVAAQFFEQKATSSASPSPSSAVSSGTGLDANFPSGKIPCSQFPSDYGAITVPWLGTDGWTGLQIPDQYTPGAAINTLTASTSGGCKSGMFCSYACPPGHQKTQWPESSQGATGQSVGGLWCNSAGFLELTRPSHPTLCAPGAGGVFVQNNLGAIASICRTDYPGSENMVVPLQTTPGGQFPLTNPKSDDYYVWQGQSTTAQYYLNPVGLDVQNSCLWVSPAAPSSAGNWAPTNLGVGMDAGGITYIGLFPNVPTTSAVLDYNIHITGDVTVDCWLKNGVYAVSSNGCTVCDLLPLYNPPYDICHGRREHRAGHG
jgi:hypothetical protein